MLQTSNEGGRKAWLYLQDGTFLEGEAFGAEGTAGGELCFTTGMTGYQEVFTDPSFTGQVLIMNNVYVGNYGVKEDETESDRIRISALVARNITDRYSRLMANDSLNEYFLKNNIVAISGIDTRALVAHVRTKGAMNAIVSTVLNTPEKLAEQLKQVPDMEGLDLSQDASTIETYSVGAADARYKIAVYDFGCKQHILKYLVERDAQVKVFPAKTNVQEIIDYQPDGFFISNGPGDPAAMDYAVENLKAIMQTGKPIFGICLGHQLLAKAIGLSTYKMHHGHRGLNHPVKNLITGNCEITTQNHGFVIDAETVKNNDQVEVTHINLNDNSIEGLRLKNYPAFSVQYHPESTPGPQDSRYLFDDFIRLIEQSKS